MQFSLFTRSVRVSLVCLAGLLFSHCSNNGNEETRAESRAFSGCDFSGIQTGDIIVKQGRGPVSRMIYSNLKEPIPLSHCGVLISEGDSVYIIHSVAEELTGVDGVQHERFNTFLDDCTKGYLYIVRYKGSDHQREVIGTTAKAFLTRHVVFDYEINYDDSSRVNCSELIYWGLKNASGKDLMTRIKVKDKYPLGFNSLLDTANFRIVYKY